MSVKLYTLGKDLWVDKNLAEKDSPTAAFTRSDEPNVTYIVCDPAALGANLEDILSHEAIHSALIILGLHDACILLDRLSFINRWKTRPPVGGF